ncbi:HNH endonuclease [Sungkyunkwania multivorans]|uniref:HNH endonuclease n=1 Tax=Sungkyunkwania multivorans TaxID=1173618 RepID=A0ABW3CTS9_9FLAO
MSEFRAKTPKRRNITTTVSNYRKHKDNLKIDYLDRCGYCNSIDTWRFVWFEIDHFVPQKYLKTIKDTDYINLVYACRSCNNSKRAKWPTKDEKKHNENDEGFIDPCDDEYANQFDRTGNGRILPTTNIGHWMYKALKLYKPQHEIIWSLDELDKLIQEIEDILKTKPNNQLKDKLLDCYREFMAYSKKLSNEGL